MVFWNFLNFFDIFLEFSIPGRVETHRNDYFYSFSFSAFPILFWLEKKLWWCFPIFWIFLEFCITGRVATHRKDFFFFFLFPLFLSLSQPVLARKEAMMGFSNFLNFFAIFLESSIMGQVGTHWNDFFYFLSFSAIPNLFWLEMKRWWCFEIFWIFLLFYWNFLFPVWYEPIRTIFFIFSISRPFPTYFSLKRSHDGVF